MIVSVEDGLFDVKKGLMGLGYEVYDFKDNVPSDAYIYSSYNTGLNSLKNSVSPGEDGSLLVDAVGKDLSEIQYILNSRLYSPLFKITDSPKGYV